LTELDTEGILLSFTKLCVGNDIFYSNCFLFLNTIMIFRGQFALLESYEWRRRLGGENKIIIKNELTNSRSVFKPDNGTHRRHPDNISVPRWLKQESANKVIR